MTKILNSLDSSAHRVVIILAVFALLFSIGSVLSLNQPIPTEPTTIGAGVGQAVGSTLLMFFSAGIACIGLIISASAMRVAKGKRKTAANKQAVWYLLFYFAVLTLPLLLFAIGV